MDNSTIIEVTAARIFNDENRGATWTDDAFSNGYPLSEDIKDIYRRCAAVMLLTGKVGKDPQRITHAA